MTCLDGRCLFSCGLTSEQRESDIRDLTTNACPVLNYYSENYFCKETSEKPPGCDNTEETYNSTNIGKIAGAI